MRMLPWWNVEGFAAIPRVYPTLIPEATINLTAYLGNKVIIFVLDYSQILSRFYNIHAMHPHLSFRKEDSLYIVG